MTADLLTAVEVAVDRPEWDGTRWRGTVREFVVQAATSDDAIRASGLPSLGDYYNFGVTDGYVKAIEASRTSLSLYSVTVEYWNPDDISESIKRAVAERAEVDARIARLQAELDRIDAIVKGA